MGTFFPRRYGEDLSQVEYSGCDELISEELSKWLDSPAKIRKRARYFYEPVVKPVDSSSSSTGCKCGSATNIT